MNQPDHTAAAAKRFSDDDSALKWTDMYSSETERLDETNFRRRRDATVSYVLDWLPSGGAVLDVGCGAAPVVSELRKNGVTCYGIEYAEDMIRHAKTRLRSMGLDEGGLYRGDCRAMPFDDGSFDAVVCLGLISYVENFGEVLEEIRRLLKPGGIALVSFRNKHNPVLSDPVRLAKTIIKALIGRLKPEPYKIGRFMDHREVRAKFADCGFEYRDFIGIGFGPFRLNGRKLFGERTSIRISRFLSSFFAKLGWQAPFRWLADVSLWVYTSPAERTLFDR